MLAVACALNCTLESFLSYVVEGTPQLDPQCCPRKATPPPSRSLRTACAWGRGAPAAPPARNSRATCLDGTMPPPRGPPLRPQRLGLQSLRSESHAPQGPRRLHPAGQPLQAAAPSGTPGPPLLSRGWRRRRRGAALAVFTRLARIHADARCSAWAGPGRGGAGRGGGGAWPGQGRAATAAGGRGPGGGGQRRAQPGAGSQTRRETERKRARAEERARPGERVAYLYRGILRSMPCSGRI